MIFNGSYGGNGVQTLHSHGGRFGIAIYLLEKAQVDELTKFYTQEKMEGRLHDMQCLQDHSFTLTGSRNTST